MKDITREALEAHRPLISTMEAITFCLEQLYRDKSKCLEDEVVDALIYEELIGALLLARDLAEDAEEHDKLNPETSILNVIHFKTKPNFKKSKKLYRSVHEIRDQLYSRHLVIKPLPKSAE